jgi:hypothetical protein
MGGQCIALAAALSLGFLESASGLRGFKLSGAHA